MSSLRTLSVTLLAGLALLLGPIGSRNPSRQLELKFVLETFKLAVGVKQGEPRLLQTVSDWVKANLKNGKLNEIYRKYHGNDLPEVILKEGV